MEQKEQPGTNGDQICDQCTRHGQYCVWLPEGVWQKSCDHCAALKMVCTISGIRVSKKKSQVEVELEAELEGSGTRGVETSGFLCLGGDPGAPKGAEWGPKKDSP